MKSYVVKTGLIRLSYANIWEAKQDMSGRLKYSASLIIDGDDKSTLAKFNNTIKEMLADPEVLKVLGGKTKNIRLPVRNGNDREGDANYEGNYFVNANANEGHPPTIVDRKGDPIYEKAKVYSGCYCLAVVSLYPYNQAGNRGIGAGLQGLMLIKDGEPLTGGGRITADSFDTSGLPDDVEEATDDDLDLIF